MNRKIILSFVVCAALITAALLVWNFLEHSQAQTQFDGERAYQDVLTQMNFGPRIPGSAAHTQTIQWITAQLTPSGWTVQILDSVINGQVAHNILAKRGSGPITMIGAHFDSRIDADQDPDPARRKDPVPAANDGASGVAVLVELGRTLPKLDKEVWLVFFDQEDQGDINGRSFIEGSTAFAANLKEKPAAVVVIDMIGDANLNIYYEQSSNLGLKTAIWKTAADLGYDKSFIQQDKYNMIDDHTPFLLQGIPAVDIIDFDYPYWHTTADTADKVSPSSLNIVGDTLWHWLQNGSGQ